MLPLAEVTILQHHPDHFFGESRLELEEADLVYFGADHREDLPRHSIWAFVLALTTCLALWGAIFYAWWFLTGLLLSGIVLIYWFWPKEEELRDDLMRERGEAV